MGLEEHDKTSNKNKQGKGEIESYKIFGTKKQWLS